MDEAGFVQITRQKKIAETDFNPLINYIYEQIWQGLFPPQILTDDLTTRVANNIITPPDAPVPDCRTCGACCVALPCVGVRPDEKISSEDYWDITVRGENGDEFTVDRFVRRDGKTFACTALEGKVGESVTCRIYERRPRICHYFEAGSDKCHALRRAYGFEPFLSLMEMFEATQKLKARPAKSAADDDNDAIERAIISQREGTKELQISVLLKYGSVKIIHAFDPEAETWRQFEFDGLTLRQAEDLIAGRAARNPDDVFNNS